LIELLRRVENRLMRPPQMAASLRMLRGEVAQMMAGECKSMVGRFGAGSFAVDEGAVHMTTSRRSLAIRDYEALVKLYKDSGIDVVPINPDEKITLRTGPDGKPVPTIIVGTDNEFAFY